MCNPLSLVTEQEMKAIECQINNCADEPLQTDVPYILREWNAQKQDLFNSVFGGKSLILSRQVTFTKSTAQITNEIDSAWDCSMTKPAQEFWRDFVNFCQEQRRKIYNGRTPVWSYIRSEEEIWAEQEWYRCEQLTSNYVLAANETNEEFTVDLPKPDGSIRKYRVQKGSKPMRVLGRLVNAYHFSSEDNFKEFCVWHSRMLNDKRVDGEFCLSIHPLDYMTMSENNCDWTSCMNWPEGGCYRGGTIEMMNSPMVIVAYMKSKVNPLMMDCGWNRETNSRQRLEWNSKKWRTLIIVDKTGIYSVKSYPYTHKEMTQYAMEWIASAIQGRHFEETELFTPYEPIKLNEDLTVEVCPRTYRMYNDFGSTDHYVMFDLDAIKKLKIEQDDDILTNIYIMYSGASECMSCGSLAYISDNKGTYFDGEGQLICTNCGGGCSDECECEICGEYWPNDEIIWVDDSPVCPDCLNEECFEDVWEYDYHFNSDGIQLYILSKDGKEVEMGMVYINYLKDWVEDPENKEFLDTINNRKDRITINVKDLNSRGLHRYERTMRNRERQLGWIF